MSMFMPVMHIRPVRMGMDTLFVPVHMLMRLYILFMPVIVVHVIVPVQMGMLCFSMFMHVLMAVKSHGGD